MLISRLQLEEDKETTITRFFEGLNPDRADKVDLQAYED